MRKFFERWGWAVTILSAAMAVYVVSWKESFSHGYSKGKSDCESDIKWAMREEVVGPIRFDNILIEKVSANEFKIWRLKSSPDGSFFRKKHDAK